MPFLSILKLFLSETIVDFIYFPLWWYSRGAGIFLSIIKDFLEKKQFELSISFLFKNLHKPLFGDYSLLGRMVGIVVRTFRLIRAVIILSFWTYCGVLAYLLWIFMPLFIVYQIVMNYNAIK